MNTLAEGGKNETTRDLPFPQSSFVLLYHQEFGLEMKVRNNAAGPSSWNVGRGFK